MAQENELERLEKFVSTLLQKFNDLQQKNKDLTDLLQKRELTIQALEGDLSSMKDERGDISSRVSSLIGQIEEWEGENASFATEAERTDEEDNSSESGVQGNLFTADAQNAS